MGDSWLPEGLPIAITLMLIVSSFVTSAITAALGVGGGLALLALLLLVLPPAVVIPVHGLVQLGSNAGRTLVLRASIDRPLLGWFAAGSIVGTIIGALVARQVFTTAFSPWMLGVLAVFILCSLWAPTPAAFRLGHRGFAGLGVLLSCLTLFLGATGPLMAAFLNLVESRRQNLVATHGACMTVQHVLKVLAFVTLGFAFDEWLALVGLMIASGFLGTLLGKRVLDALPEIRFRRYFRIALSIVAFHLLWRAFVTGG